MEQPKSPRVTASVELGSRQSLLRPICSSRASRVAFHHPAYDSTRLLELSAFDGPDGGIHHGTALLLCGIIAGNIWNGWLTETRDGEKISLDTDALLTNRDYYFHLHTPEGQNHSRFYKYPIPVSFRHWSFPHDNPPFGWEYDVHLDTISSFPTPSVSSVSQAVRDRDGSCRISSFRDGIERAHVCPRSELDWFTKQEMDKYNLNNSLSGASLVDDMANAVTLRQDIHAAFDSRTFVFTKRENAWISYFLTPTFNLGPAYHNEPIELPPTVSPAFLLARLAWAIFPKIENFLCRGEKRLVTLKEETTGAYELKEFTGQELRAILGIINTRGRSNSPRKRQRDEDTRQPPDVAGDTNFKRARPNPAQAIQSGFSSQLGLSNFSIPALTPDYTEPDTTSKNSQQQSLEMISQDLAEENSWQRIARLRRDALADQRNFNAKLACCDYNAAEKANLAGLEGPRKFGGAHVCLECLGADYSRTADSE